MADEGARPLLGSMAGGGAKFVLECLGAELGGRRGVGLEFSLRLRPGWVDALGRFGCWLSGRDRSAFEPITRALERLGAPASVLTAQRGVELPVRQGIAAAAGEGGYELRLYVHARDPATLADRYHAIRWGPGAEPRRSRYAFHFFPETPAGLRPLERIDERLRPAFERLLADERLRQGSGFWLRESEGGELEQVDLAWPWCPIAGSLEGLNHLAELLELPAEEASGWREVAIRHVATGVGAASPAVTLYASAPLRGPWPTDEAALKEQVCRGARALHDAAERDVYRRLPRPAASDAGGAELDRFYGGDPKTWRAVLGPELHYHAGLFAAPCAEPDDSEMDEALRRAVTELYPFLPAGGRVYDVGCGWGGPLAMWTRDLGCRSLGLTISRAQFRYVAGLGLPVRWGDAEQTLPPGRFDCAILLESLSHIRDKARLLRVLRAFADRLVMRVNCQDGSPAGVAFGGTMHMVSSARLRELLEASGWRVRHWRDRRAEAVPAVAAWRRRLRSVPVGRDRHLETLRAWCERVATGPDRWAHHNPLIEVVSE